MNFQRIPAVEGPKALLEKALRRGREAALRVRPQKGGRERSASAARMEAARVAAISDSLFHSLSTIISSFPSINALPPFYQELFRVTSDVDALRQGLAKVQWTGGKIRSLGSESVSRLRKLPGGQQAKRLSAAFLGRVASLLRNLAPSLGRIERARKSAKEFPDVKEDRKTVVIFGFPNVGKTTLLAKLTGSTAAIAEYAFTTKGINAGNLILGGEAVQVFDTPGTLARFDKMNNIEKIAHLTVRHLAGVVVYVLDPTEPYPLKEQERLFRTLKETGKPVVRYISKTDVAKTDVEGVRNLGVLKSCITEMLELERRFP